MMSKLCNVIVLIAVLAVAVTARAQSVGVLLQKGVYQEETVGDLDAAIEIYEEIISAVEASRPHLAQAYYRLATCYLKKGQKDKAAETLRKLVGQFPEQTKVVARARARLSALGHTPSSATASGMTIRRVWDITGLDIEGEVSRDGRYLCFQDPATGDLAVRDLVTGKNRRLTNNQASGERSSDAVISPDGKRVAYAWHVGPESMDLRLIGFDGSRPRVLYRHEEVFDVEPVAWSPDGKQILAQFKRKDGSRQIVWVSVADGSVRVLKSPGWWDSPHAYLSPDGRWIAYDLEPAEGVEPEDIFLLAADGSSEVPLVKHPADDDVVGWTPDGKGLLFRSNRAGSQDLWLIRMVDGKPQGSPVLVRKNVNVSSDNWGRGMTEKGALYYTTFAQVSDVYLATLDPISGKVGRPKPFPQGFLGDVRSLDWSPDGKYLAYQPKRGESGRIVIRSLQTGEDRELSLPNVRPERYDGFQLSWSPDGRGILFHGFDERDLDGLYQVRPETGETTRIVQADRGFEIGGPVSSLDGRKVFYALISPYLRNQNGRILVRDLATGKETELYHEEERAFETRNASISPNLAISPDGRLLAFGAPWIPGRGVAALKVIPVAGGKPRELVRFARPDELRRGMNVRDVLGWTPDGRYLLFFKTDYEKKTELWRISVDGGEPEKLGETEGVSIPHLHPDGRQMALNAVQFIRELWVMENFLPELKGGK